MLLWRVHTYYGNESDRINYEAGKEFRNKVWFWQLAAVVVACGDVFYLLRFWLVDCQRHFLGNSKQYPENYDEGVENEAEVRRKRLLEYKKTWDKRYR